MVHVTSEAYSLLEVAVMLVGAFDMRHLAEVPPLGAVDMINCLAVADPLLGYLAKTVMRAPLLHADGFTQAVMV